MSEEKLNILVVYQYFLDKGEAGLSRYNKMVEYWEEQGHQVTVISGDVHYSTGIKADKYKGRFLTKETYSDNVKVVKCYVAESYNKSFLGRLWGYFSFTISSTYAMLFKVKKHDVLIVSSPSLFTGITGLFGKHLKRMPFIFEIRDIWPQSAIDLGILKSGIIIKLSYWLEQLFYKHADKNIVLTPAFKKYLIAEKGIDESKIGIVTNGADLDVFYPIDKKSKSYIALEKEFEDKFIVMYFGSHSTANRLDLLLNVANKMRSYSDILFVLIGSGKEKENLIEFAKSNNLENVRFEDSMPRNQLNEYANLANVCTTILPNIEVFKTVYPSKLFDYMALGKPILIGFDGIAKDLVVNNEIGLYASVENIETFENQILKLYNDRELCLEMGRKARELAMKDFNRETLANEYIKQIKQLLK